MLATKPRISREDDILEANNTDFAALFGKRFRIRTQARIPLRVRNEVMQLNGRGMFPGPAVVAAAADGDYSPEAIITNEVIAYCRCRFPLIRSDQRGAAKVRLRLHTTPRTRSGLRHIDRPFPWKRLNSTRFVIHHHTRSLLGRIKSLIPGKRCLFVSLERVLFVFPWSSSGLFFIGFSEGSRSIISLWKFLSIKKLN